MLDADSMQLLDSLPPESSAQTSAGLHQQQVDKAEAAARPQRQQQLKNRTLLLTYASEAALIAARDHDLAYRQKAIKSQLKNRMA